MNTETLTLTDFLLARIAEDEMAALISTPGPWLVRDRDDGYLFVASESLAVVSAERPTDLAHVARHDPARALAECEAKRRIVERCSAVEPLMPSDHLARGVLALLALPYVDHPDFRDEWRP